MSHTRKQAIQDLLEIIRAYPGRTADFYISEIIKAYGVKKETASDYLKTLGETGMIITHGLRIYPRGYILEEEKKLEENLLRMLREKSREEPTDIEKENTSHTIEKSSTTLTTESTIPKQEIAKQDQSQHYLLVYDLDSKILGSERRQIYRRLRRAYKRLLEDGVYVERVQMSVWKLEGRENAYKLASALPKDKAKIRIYKVLEGEDYA